MTRRKTSDLPFKVEMGTLYFAPADSAEDQQLVNLFEAFGYDIGNSQHWRWLLGLLSKAHFERHRGRPVKWTEERRIRLFVHLYALKKEGKSSDDRKIQAHLLKENFRLDPFYKSVSETEIYKNLLRFFREMERATRR